MVLYSMDIIEFRSFVIYLPMPLAYIQAAAYRDMLKQKKKKLKPKELLQAYEQQLNHFTFANLFFQKRLRILELTFELEIWS